MLLLAEFCYLRKASNCRNVWAQNERGLPRNMVGAFRVRVLRHLDFKTRFQGRDPVCEALLDLY